MSEYKTVTRMIKICDESGCFADVHAREKCRRHWRLLRVEERRVTLGERCDHDGCDGGRWARGLCRTHYKAWFHASKKTEAGE